MEDVASGPSSGSGIKRQAEDPPQDPRLALPGPSSEAISISTTSRGTKRNAETAEIQLDPMQDEETAVTNLLLEQRRGFLGNLQAQMERDPSTLPVCEEKFEIDFEEPTVYWDNVSGKPLKAEKVQAARLEECEVIKSMGVWEPIPRPKNEKVITTRWVDVNKGDEIKRKYRSRFVAREIKKKGDGLSSWTDFFASMPPITALRVLFSLAVTRRVPDINGNLKPMPKDTCLIFIDVKKAHFWSPARRRLLVELPPEMGYGPDMVGLLKKSLWHT